MKNHFSTIGIVVLNKMCENFNGNNILTEDGMEFSDHQDKLQVLFIGGTVVHIYYYGAISGEKAKHIVKPKIEMDSEDILDKVINDPCNEGIILSGLEWSLQPKELREMVNSARKRKFKIMVYFVKIIWNNIVNLRIIILKSNK
ncbi:hypothetical protein [Clostridium perfringens]|uniref:hypothetical protein n=1 Tax=Clostridium perfringens TaxID=1502 RepID=UPI001FABE85A|nr:hypothetical protein [Clostridium perfringens]